MKPAAPTSATPVGEQVRSSVGERHSRDRLSVLPSNIALIAARVASMGLGFLAWLFAARLFTPSEVGLASALVAAMMLCVQLGLVGVGSAIVALLHIQRGSAARTVDVGATVVVLSVLGVTIGYFLLAMTVLGELSVVVTLPYAIAFLAMTTFGTLNTYYDYVSVALRRGDQVLVRNVVFGVVTLATLALAAALLNRAPGSLIVLAAWAAAGLAACAIAVVQVTRALGAPPQPRWDPALTRRLVSVGWPNWLLTLAERAPALAMPVLVAELLSPTTNAFWYAAWMMGWVVLIIPISIGQSVFAEVSRDPDRARDAVLHGLRSSLAVGVPAAIGMAVIADVALTLLGSSYAEASAPALRILVLSVVPVTLIQAYYAVSRARGALSEAIVVGVLGGTATVAAALVAGRFGGLVAMAGAWVVGQIMVAVWAAVRLRMMFPSSPVQRRGEAGTVVS